jgi:hypothetical protein
MSVGVIPVGQEVTAAIVFMERNIAYYYELNERQRLATMSRSTVRSTWAETVFSKDAFKDVRSERQPVKVTLAMHHISCMIHQCPRPSFQAPS